MFTPFRFRPDFYKRKRFPSVNDTPVRFAVTREGSNDVEESILLTRPVVKQLLELGPALDLYYLPTVPLHGVARLDSAKVQRLVKDLRIVFAKAENPSVRDAVSRLLPLTERIAQDPSLSLLMAAGR